MSASSASAPKPPFYAFAGGAADIEALRQFADAHQWAASCIKEGDITTAAAFLKQNPSPQFLLVELSSPEHAPQHLTELAEVCDPDTKVAVAGEINEYSFYCWLMDIGISSYLLKPLSAKVLEGAWEKATQPAAGVHTGAAARAAGQVVGVMGARGGVGATSVAIYLAALGEQAGKKTVLVDLDPQDGSVALLLDLDPSRGFREAMERPERIDNLFIERACNRLKPNFHVLSAEESIHEPVRYHERAAETLLHELRDAYDLIVLDIPRTPNVFFHACARLCETVFVITDLTLTGLSAGIRLNELFKDHLKRTPPVFVANRVGLNEKYEIPAAEYGKGIGAKVEYSIPFAPDAFMSLSGELKALKHPNTPAMKALQRLGGHLFPAAEEQGKETAKKPGGLAGLLKKGK
ncbi:MAG: AAA family ATPase [Alphaproteobacteria bacterium]|nr:AAA family ATPase [Alphaproteobacteria bacterium]